MKRILLLVVALAVAGLAAGVWWVDRRNAASGWQGYVDADYVRIGPTQSGQLTRLFVHRGDTVAAGAPLFQQDDVDDRAARDQATARLAQAEAQLTNLQTASRETEIAQAEADLMDMRATRDRIANDVTRDEGQLRVGAVSHQVVDQMHADLASANAHVEASEAKLAQMRAPTGRQFEIAAQAATVKEQRAALAQAEWMLAQRHVAAPAGGVISDTMALPGEMLAAGAPVVSLLPPGNIFIRLFVPETALAAIHIGERLEIACDSCAPGLIARISYIAPQPEYTPPVIYSEAAREKLVYLVEARPAVADAATLKPGQPVTVRVAPGTEAETPPPLEGGGRGEGCVQPPSADERTPPPGLLPQGEGESRHPCRPS
jgi:HlyD family secretion protein